MKKLHNQYSNILFYFFYIIIAHIVILMPLEISYCMYTHRLLTYKILFLIVMVIQTDYYLLLQQNKGQ